METKKSIIIENFKKHLSRENLVKLSVSDWKKIFSNELSMIYSTKVYKFNPKYLYRARCNFDNLGKNLTFFQQTKDLWAPPHKKVKKQGRCNSAGQSLLYCSTSLTTALFEIKPLVNSEITFIEYCCVQDFKPIVLIGVNELFTVDESYQKIFGNHFKDKSKDSILLDDILSSIFITSNYLDFPIYNLTNAITQIFLNKQNENNESETHIGLIYPSVATSKTIGANIVMNPIVAKKLLKPKSAYKYKIRNVQSPHYYEIELTHKTSKIAENGYMTWCKIPDPFVEFITDLP